MKYFLLFTHGAAAWETAYHVPETSFYIVSVETCTGRGLVLPELALGRASGTRLQNPVSTAEPVQRECCCLFPHQEGGGVLAPGPAPCMPGLHQIAKKRKQRMARPCLSACTPDVWKCRNRKRFPCPQQALPT